MKKHPFFRDINWDSILKKEVKAPFIPKLKDEEDTSHIDPEFTNMPISLTNGLNSLEPSNNMNYHGKTFNLKFR